MKSDPSNNCAGQSLTAEIQNWWLIVYLPILIGNFTHASSWMVVPLAVVAVVFLGRNDVAGATSCNVESFM